MRAGILSSEITFHSIQRNLSEVVKSGKLKEAAVRIAEAQWRGSGCTLP